MTILTAVNRRCSVQEQMDAVQLALNGPRTNRTGVQPIGHPTWPANGPYRPAGDSGQAGNLIARRSSSTFFTVPL